MNAERNTRAKATCCLSDLHFLFPIANDHGFGNVVANLIEVVQSNPTEPVITAAWKQVAIIYDTIRKQ